MTVDVPSPQAAGPVALDRAVEAMLFVAEEPQPAVALATALDTPVDAVRKAIARLVADYNGEAAAPCAACGVAGQGVPRAFELREVGGGWRFYVREAYDRVVSEFVSTTTATRLSQAALETLAVIAYKQPITRSAIAAIRAVNVDSVVRTLLSRGLIAEVDTEDELNATAYGTTPQFLALLGLNSLRELPPISPLLDDGTKGFEGDPRINP